MGLKLTDAITVARGILQDTDSTNYRYSSADLLLYGNDALDAMTLLAPHLFYTDGDVTCIEGSALQTISFDDALSLVKVRRIKNGNAVVQADPETLDAFDSSWQEASNAAAVNWFPVANDPMRFMIYPPAPTGQILEVVYVRIPTEYALTDDTGLPTTYKDAVADYIVYRAESRDDEHVNSNRAAQFLTSFQQKVKGA